MLLMYIVSWFMLGSITAPLPLKVAILFSTSYNLLLFISDFKLEEGSSYGHLNVMNPECPALSVGHWSL
jgi:hypothetical protein